jgi:hypothetical protein
MHNTCPVDGYPYTDHPPGEPPTARYLRVRQAFVRAIAEVIYWPGISEAHRLAIVRARQDRQAVSR